MYMPRSTVIHCTHSITLHVWLPGMHGQSLTRWVSQALFDQQLICTAQQAAPIVCVRGWGLTKWEGHGRHIPWWAGPNGVANDNLNLILPIGGEALELVCSESVGWKGVRPIC